MASKIMIIRHAEKPNGKVLGDKIDGSNDPESLIPQGWQRAGALASFFDPSRAWSVAGIQIPTSLFAAAPGNDDQHSARPLETITPLAAKLNMQVNSSFKKEALADMVAAAKASKGVVLISWQHEDIPAIANLIIPAPNTIPQKWPGDRFDVVWVFDAQANGAYAFSQVTQQLLAGDLTTPISA
ncbi:MAG: hypothetical protein RL748_1812 [Pseudomonadota bacterium]|jgi:broad specificity phosphatase PhoE